MRRQENSLFRKTAKIVLALTAALAFVLAAAGTRSSAYAAAAEITVNGQTLNSKTPRLDSLGAAEAGSYTSGDIAYFDSASGTLDLYSGTIDKADANYACIFSKGKLNIVLNGDTGIVGSDSDKQSFGIFCQNDLTISGSGSLNINAGSGDAENLDGIYCDRHLVFNGGTVTACGGNNGGWSLGIFCDDITVNSGTKLTATGKVANDLSAGIEYCNTMTINGGSVTAFGSHNAISEITPISNKTGTVTLGSGMVAYTAAAADPYEGTDTIYASGTQLAADVKWFSTSRAVRSATDIKGKIFSSGKLKYRITKVAGSAYGEVQVTGAVEKTYKSLTIPQTVSCGLHTYTVTSVAKNAFKAEKKLKKITFRSNAITFIGKGAFKKCAIKCSFRIPKSEYSKYVKLLKKSGVPQDSKFRKI